MNPKLNKKVKKFLDAYFKGTSASSPEAHHALMFILKGALTDANFHSTSKKVDKLFPKAKNAKYFGKRDWEDSLEDKGVDIATMAKWDGHDIIDAIGFFVSMYVGGPLGKKIEALKNESFKREHKLLENLSVLVEKNVPTNPSKWSYYKSQAKKKFDVYPSAYANAWAAKQYKAAGGGWRKTKGESIKVPEEDTVNEKVSVFDERHFGKKGIIIMIDDNGKKISAIFKDKKNADKFNRNNPSDIKKLLQLAKAKKFPRTIDESVINELTIGKMAKKYKNRDNFISAFFKHMKKHYGDSFKDFEKDKKYRETIGKAWDREHGVKESVNEVSDSEIKKSIKKKERGGPYTIIVRHGNMSKKVVDHSPKSYDKVEDAIKMYHKYNKKHKGRGVSIEDGYGRTVFMESTINEISAEGGLKRVIKGQTREVEGIKLSVPMAQAMLDWFNSSPYGRKYPKAKKAKLNLSLGIMMGFGLDRYAKHKGAKDELKYINTLAKAMRESTIKHLKSLNEGSMDWEKDFPWANEKELKVISKFINMNKRGIDGVLKMQKKDYKGFVRTVQKMVKLLPLMEIMEGKYNYKDDAMTAYMKGKISAQELDKIAKNDFKSSVATKQELQNFLKAGYMKELMANTYGLKVSDMEKKVKELMKYAS